MKPVCGKGQRKGLGQIPPLWMIKTKIFARTVVCSNLPSEPMRRGSFSSSRPPAPEEKDLVIKLYDTQAGFWFSFFSSLSWLS